MTTLENINPTIGLNAEVHNSQNADILNNVTMLHEKSEPPIDEKLLSKLSNLSNDPQALEPQDLAARQLDTTLSNDCLMLSNLSSKNEQTEENAQKIDEKCSECYTEEDKKQPNVTQKNDDVTRRVTLSEKQPIDLKTDFSKLSRVNKIAWYAQQGFDVLLGFRGQKGAGKGWNIPNRQRMTPEEAINAATINGAYAMGLSHSHGTITVGKQANIFITKPIPSLAYIPYAYGRNLVETCILNGKVYA